MYEIFFKKKMGREEQRGREVGNTVCNVFLHREGVDV
jgi:hypothetical protein